MYSEVTLEKYAEVLFWGLTVARRGRFAKSDLVLVGYDHEALPLAEAVCALLHERGLVPVARAAPSPRMEHDLYALANNKRLTMKIPGERELYGALSGSITLHAPTSLTHLEDVDPELLNMRRLSRRDLRNVLLKREALGEYAWTLCIYPTEELAARAGMPLETFADCVRRACLLDDGTPVTRWKLLSKQAGEIKAWLNALDPRALHLESASTDLRVNVGERRKWVGITGRNIPSFEIYTSPDWRGAEGVFTADQPCYRTGNRIEHVRISFARGQAMAVSAELGQAFAYEQLTMDEGAGRIGEFALVDRRFSRIDRFMANTLYDENHGGEHGSCHIAMGNSYDNTFDGDPTQLDADRKAELGFNVSSLHWDLVNTEPKTVTAIGRDGSRTVIYEHGEFTY
ncbi:MAG: aminopeptidase [Desulfovibrionaceae bacterium]|nr:aminopeptidase [Desulfovibrionaceae bacterium]